MPGVQNLQGGIVADPEDIGWVQTNWSQIVFFLTLGAFGVKNHMDTRQVKTAVYDRNGEIRFVSKNDCGHCKAGRDRELQNIHEAIAGLKDDMSKMPQEIAEHLKVMGLLK